MRYRLPPQLAPAALFFLLLITPPTHAQGGPPPEVRRAVDAIVQVLAATDEAAMDRFAAEHLTPEYRGSFGPGELKKHLAALREAARGTGSNRSLRREDDGLYLVLEGGRTVTFRLGLTPGGLVNGLDLAKNQAAEPDEEPPTLTWAGLGETLRAAEREGFSGTVLAVHEGKTVLAEAYGVADRENGARTQLDTVYCIGSMPIDFTRTAVRLLAERGKLRLDDSISRFLNAVPADKRPITLDHLMTGASGLPDFHHLPDKDWDFDLTALDREAALARIFSQHSLFPPGTSRRHSHSAFVLLAAIVEVASGQSYPEFLRTEIFAPAGMRRTGFYGETLGLKARDFATGYGASAVGLPNISPNWGPTSWLVMGSGGMSSTLGDLQRYYEALDGGKILREVRRGPTMGIGGSDRGYFVLHLADGKGSRVLLMTNGGGRQPIVRALVRGLERLLGVERQGAPAVEQESSG